MAKKEKEIKEKYNASDPRYWTEERKQKAINHILTEISEKGSSVRSVLDGADRKELPSNVTFCEWLSKDEELAKQYAYAKRLGIEMKFQSIEQDYSESPRLDPETGRVDTGWVQYQRLKIDSKKWELSKLAPKVYGDKIEVDANVNAEVNSNQTIDLSNIPSNVLEELLKHSHKND